MFIYIHFLVGDLAQLGGQRTYLMLAFGPGPTR